MGILQAEGNLEHPAEDAPTSLRRQNGSAVPQFPYKQGLIKPFLNIFWGQRSQSFGKKLFKKSPVPGLASLALPTSHVKNALESHQVFEMR